MKKYQVIYADCPWRYNFCKDNSDKIERHYPTMDLEEIKSLNIPADKNAVLFLWATAPKLLEALYVMRAWGFKYKTQAIWDKKWIGRSFSNFRKLELFAREKAEGWDSIGYDINGKDIRETLEEMMREIDE